jgi:hypothetical protein
VIAAAVVLALAIAGCGSSHSSPVEPVGQDSIQIASLSPAAGTTLTAGTTVTFKAVLNFGLESSPGGVILVSVEDQNGRVLNAGNQPLVVLPGGAGTVTLSFQGAVPATGVSVLQLSFALMPSVPLPTPPTATAAYPVVS